MGDEYPKSIPIPLAARGLHVLLVDENISSLMYISSVLEQHFYKVITTGLASVALSIIREGEDQVDLVIADTNMKEMDIFTFLRHILSIRDIPIIFMYYQENRNIASKALEEGACFFLHKPTSPRDLVNVWQHVYRRRVFQEMEKQKAENGKNIGQTEVHPHGQAIYFDQVQSNRVNNGTENVLQDGYLVQQLNDICVESMITLSNQKAREFGRYEWNYEFEKRKPEEHRAIADGKRSRRRRRIKSRMKWTHEFHLKFMEAISMLGEEKARPRAILNLMNEPSLTLRHVASHLQKYRDRVRRINANTKSHVLQSNMARTTYHHLNTSASHARLWYWPNSVVHTQAFAAGSSIHHNLTNLQKESFPWNSMHNPSSFSANNLRSTIGSWSIGSNYSSANQLDRVLPSTYQAPVIDTFVGVQGATQESNAVAHPNLLPSENIVENPQGDFAEFLKFIEENEGQLEEASDEQDSDNSDGFMEWLSTPNHSDSH